MGTNQPSPPPVLSPQERLDQLQRELVARRKQVNRSTTWTAIIGLLALILVGVYFGIGYSWLKEFENPDTVLNYADVTLQDKLPEARLALEKQIKDQAPVWAESLSKQAQDSLPTARQKLEEIAMDRYEDAVEQAGGLSEEQFRKFLSDNRKMMEDMFKQLSTSSQLADDELAKVEKALEEQLKPNMQDDAKEMLETLRAGNVHMAKLKAGKDLSDEEQTERTTLMLARALEKQEKGEPLASKPADEQTKKKLPPIKKPAKAGAPPDKSKPKAPAEKSLKGKPSEPSKPTTPPKETKPDKKDGTPAKDESQPKKEPKPDKKDEAPPQP